MIALLQARSGSAPIDADHIRRTCAQALWEPALPNGEERAHLVGCLRGQTQLLMPEIQQLLPRMQGEHQRTAQHVIASANRALAIDIVTARQADALHDLATACRALLVLHEFPSPLKAPQTPVPVRPD
ncbi:hypothetical protein ADL00_02945 [Streptomyces sp. AS58]|uniref:DUF6415 family natural product biosynthesis protein n=1 Tax=Streptomyces sp. AS58 TaxID=1519489 RepID=UPI0006AEF5D8|nr:DUF6415 family natural product biosynthesis protein [Streptomyces sp. AS58]KOV74071.1 hypothetical protein ADL00_02945 [Streptomyces sp. AS58]